MLKKVGITKLSYGDIEYGSDEWVDAKRFTPAQFDLVKIKTKKKNVLMDGTLEKSGIRCDSMMMTK